MHCEINKKQNQDLSDLKNHEILAKSISYNNFSKAVFQVKAFVKPWI